MKKAINKNKRQPTERIKIFANDISGKGLMSKIHKKSHTIQHGTCGHEQQCGDCRGNGGWVGKEKGIRRINSNGKNNKK